MLLFPYNVKSAELPAPVNTNEDYRDLVGYYEYKELYDQFHVAIAPLACIAWNDDTPMDVRNFWAPQWAFVNGLMDKLTTCKYVLDTVRHSKNPSLWYRRILEDVIKK